MTSSRSQPEPSESLAHEVTEFFWRTSLTLILLTACYYLLPAEGPFHDAVAGTRWGASLIAFAGFVLVVRFQLRIARTKRTVRARAEAMLTALYALILIFAVTYNQIAMHAPGQIDGIHNQTDALYFTVTIISTVGFGDINAVGTAARAVATGQMLINLIYIGTALRVLTTLSTEPRRTTVPDEPAPIGE